LITDFRIENFRSLKDVTFNCPPLSFFCGTNLAEALDFLSKVFNNGLSYAVAEKGGFYNICFRRERRSKGAILFKFVDLRRATVTLRLRDDSTMKLNFHCVQ
jgi:AAA15 family ATPase/GTPase